MKGRLISIKRERLDRNTVEETITIHYRRPIEAASACTELGIDEEDVHFDDGVYGKALVIGACVVAVVAMAILGVVYG